MRIEIIIAILVISAILGFILGALGVPWWINGIIGFIIGVIGVLINYSIDT